MGQLWCQGLLRPCSKGSQEASKTGPSALEISIWGKTSGPRVPRPVLPGPQWLEHLPSPSRE